MSIKLLPAFKLHYNESSFLNENYDIQDIVHQLIETIAAIKRNISNEPMEVVAFYKPNEFNICSESVALIDWSPEAREHPFSAHMEFAKELNRNQFLAGTFVFEFNYRPNDSQFNLIGNANLEEMEFLAKVEELSKSLADCKVGHILDKDLQITDVRVADRPKKIMHNWRTFYVFFDWDVGSHLKHKHLKKDISEVSGISNKVLVEGSNHNPSRSAQNHLGLARSEFVVPVNYLELMNPILKNNFGEELGGSNDERVFVKEAILDSSISLLSVFGIKRAEIRNQVGRKGMFARTVYNRDISNVSAHIVPRFEGVSGELFCGVTLIRIDVMPFDGFISLNHGTGLRDFNEYATFVEEIAMDLPEVILFNDNHITISVEKRKGSAAGSSPFTFNISEDAHSKLGSRIEVSLKWEAFLR